MGHREQLLDGAKRCLRERGIAHTTARDIVAASGTNLASIGYHFGSKEALLTAAMLQTMEEWGDELERSVAVNQQSGPIERLEQIWDGAMASMLENRPLWAANFETFSHAQRNEEIQKRFTRAHEHARKGFASIVLAGHAPVDDATVRAVGSLILALISGLAVQWLVAPEAAPTGRDLTAALRAVVALSDAGA